MVASNRIGILTMKTVNSYIMSNITPSVDYLYNGGEIYIYRNGALINVLSGIVR